MTSDSSGIGLGIGVVGIIFATILTVFLQNEFFIKPLAQDRDQLKTQLTAAYVSPDLSPMEIRRNIIGRGCEILELEGKKYLAIVKTALDISADAETRISHVKTGGWGQSYPVYEGANIAVFENQESRFTMEYRCAPCHEWKFVELSVTNHSSSRTLGDLIPSIQIEFSDSIQRAVTRSREKRLEQ